MPRTSWLVALYPTSSYRITKCFSGIQYLVSILHLYPASWGRVYILHWDPAFWGRVSKFHLDPASWGRVSILHWDPVSWGRVSILHLDPAYWGRVSIFHLDPASWNLSNVTHAILNQQVNRDGCQGLSVLICAVEILFKCNVSENMAP